MKIKTNFLLKKPLLVVGVTLLFGFLLGIRLSFNSSKNTSKISENIEKYNEHKPKKNIFWTCSMHPLIKNKHSGDCPICGMELVPIRGLENLMSDAINFSATAIKNAEIETSIIEKKIAFNEVTLSGKVKVDERKINKITAHFPGRIEKLYINYTGKKVRKGDLLATVFSPELVTAQKELFEAKKHQNLNQSFYNAARNKFKSWLFTDNQIDKIEKSKKTQLHFNLFSPNSGIITKRNIAKGDYVVEGTSMFQIVDLSKVWVEFYAYEMDIPWIKIGATIEISINSLPSKVFTTKITFISPVVNEHTRTVVVRAELRNELSKLKPGMFAKASIKSMFDTNNKVVLVPKSAVLWTGKNSIVYVKKEDNNESFTFLYREITIGQEVGNYYVVVDGLQPKEIVVTNGAFKVDAAAQLNGSRSMMNPTSREAIK